MINWIKILSISILFMSCANTKAIAQNTDGNKKAQELYKKADEARVFGKLEQATTLFEQAVATDPNYVNAYLQLANIYQNAYKNYDKAIENFEKAIALDKTLYPAYFYTAQNYFYKENYSKAKEYALIFKENDKTLTDKNINMVNVLIASADFAQEAIKHPVDFNPINLGPNINSDQAEYFPSVTADGEEIYFTVNNPHNKYPNEDIYTSTKVGGKWQPRTALANINTTETQEGAHSITQDGRYIFYASDRRINNLGRFDIFIAKKEGSEWKSPKNMGRIINTPDWESQPIISADSKLLFLVRKSRDGYGGSDIYVCRIDENTGQFGKPENLGNVINTPGDEQRPYLHPDGKTLYFASDGHPGMGRADLFKSTLQDDGTWSTPVNLGYPINTSDVEHGLYVSADGKTGYIASDREGGYGDMDIYSFDMPNSVKPATVVSVKGTTKDEETKKAVASTIKVIDAETEEVYKLTGSDKIDGSFLITLPTGKTYVFQASADGYLPYSENFTLAKDKESEIYQLDALMQKVAKGKEFVLKNIFFEVGKYELIPSSKAELNTLVKYLADNSDVFLEIGGHTDNTGSETANQILSENRAKAVYDYLIQQGVANNRITYKGYGESQALVPNTTEENKAKNRRTAFKVL